jgi:hypothetical protein
MLMADLTQKFMPGAEIFLSEIHQKTTDQQESDPEKSWRRRF